MRQETCAEILAEFKERSANLKYDLSIPLILFSCVETFPCHLEELLCDVGVVRGEDSLERPEHMWIRPKISDMDYDDEGMRMRINGEWRTFNYDRAMPKLLNGVVFWEDDRGVSCFFRVKKNEGFENLFRHKEWMALESEIGVRYKNAVDYGVESDNGKKARKYAP